MSRGDNQLPPIGPKPGQEPWGYDEKQKPHDTLEERMDPEQIKKQLEERFKLRKGAVILTEPILVGRKGRFEVTHFDETSVTLTGLSGGLASTYPTWFILYKFNLGAWEVEEQSDL